MGDRHNVMEKDDTSSKVESIAGQNEMMLKMEQKILGVTRRVGVGAQLSQTFP